MAERAFGGSVEWGADQPATVSAALTQVLDGITLVAAPNCGACRRSILPGRTITAYAYRPTNESRWHVPRVYCPACARTTINEPTAGWAEALVEAELVDRGGACRLTPTGVIARVGVATGTSPR